MKKILSNFLGGLNNKSRPDLIKDNEVQSLNGLKFNEEIGTLTRCPKMSLFNNLSFSYFWLWRTFTPPIIYNEITDIFEESPYFFIYVFYSSLDRKIKLRGVYGEDKKLTPYFEDEFGNKVLREYSVSQKPEIAFTGIRATFVDGIKNHLARYIEIDDSGHLFSNNTGVNPPDFGFDAKTNFAEKVGAPNLGVSEPFGSIFLYSYTAKDKTGAESNPSPISCNMSRWGKSPLSSQQYYKDIANNYNMFTKTMTLENYSSGGIGISSFNIYRANFLYSQGFLGGTEYKFSTNVPSTQGYKKDFYSNTLGKTLSYENDSRIKGDDVTLSGNVILVPNTANTIQFRNGAKKYIRIKISNPNGRNYINAVIAIRQELFQSSMEKDLKFPWKDSDMIFPEETKIMFMYQDYTTSLPCILSPKTELGVKPKLCYYVRIPYVQAYGDTFIYLTYNDSISFQVEKDLYCPIFYGDLPHPVPDPAEVEPPSDFNEDNNFFNHFTVNDARNVITIGGNEDNAFKSNSLKFNNALYAKKYMADDGYNKGLVHNPLFGDNVITNNGLIQFSSLGDIKDADLLPEELPIFGDFPKQFCYYGWFMFRKFGISGLHNIVSYKGSRSIMTLRVGIDSLGVVVEPDSGGGLSISFSSFTMQWDTPCFIYVGASTVNSEVVMYYHFLNDTPAFTMRTLGRPYTEDDSLRHFSILSYSGTTSILHSISDFHLMEDCCLTTERQIVELESTGQIYDVELLGGMNDITSSTIFVDNPKVIKERGVKGLLRWSDPQGLVFPTLNELRLSSEIIKLVPRLGTKDTYQSIIDVYTSRGIYILRLDKLSSETEVIPLTGEQNSFILQNKDSICSVGNSNYFISNNELIKQTGENFISLSPGRVNISHKKIVYLPKEEAICLIPKDRNIFLFYSLKYDYFYNQSFNNVLDIAEYNEEYESIFISNTMMKYPVYPSDLSGTMETKDFFLEASSLIRFRIDFKELGENWLFSFILKYHNSTRSIDYEENSPTSTIIPNKWYYFPSGSLCEFFSISIGDVYGIKGIEIEYKPRSR